MKLTESRGPNDESQLRLPVSGTRNRAAAVSGHDGRGRRRRRLPAGSACSANPAIANQLALRSEADRRVQHARRTLSQLESWDPKPGTATGGPFRAIPTSVPGIHISELLPQTAKQMHHLCLVRGVNTSEDDHGKGTYMMLTGRRQTPASRLSADRRRRRQGAGAGRSSLPGHILITPGGGGGRGNDAAYLGPKYSSVQLGNGNPPQNTTRPEGITEASEAARQDFRRHVNERFLNRRRTAVTEAFTYSYEQAQQLMQQREVFDVTKEPEADVERYGKHDFGRHCLLARRLLEKGITFVQLSHSNYDTHNENFNFHIEQLGEFDRSFACFVADMAARGMLDSTLIVVLSRIRPHAEHQPVLRPRPLVEGVVGVPGRLPDPARARLRQNERRRHRGRRRPSGSRRSCSTPILKPSASIRRPRSTSTAARCPSPTPPSPPVAELLT